MGKLIRRFGLLAALLAAPAHALFMDSACPGYLGCPSDVTSASVVSPTQSGGTLIFTTAVPVSAADPLHVVTGECAALAARFPSTVLGAHALMDATADGGKVFEGLPSNSGVSIDNLQPDQSNQCAAVVHEKAHFADSVTISASFSTLGAGGGVLPEVNYNPGFWVGIKTTRFYKTKKKLSDGYKSVASAMAGHDMCTLTGAENLIGVRLKFELREWEYIQGDRSLGYGLYEDLHDYFTSGDCGGVPRSLVIIIHSKSNRGDAEDGLYAPIGLESAPDSLYWLNNGGRPTGMMRIWDEGTAAPQAYRDTFIDFLQRYGNSRYLEKVALANEGAMGVNNNDNHTPGATLTYCNENVGGMKVCGREAQQFYTSMAAVVRAHAPKVGYDIGTNNYASGSDDMLVTIHEPTFTASPHTGLSFPDTFTDTAPGHSRRVPPVTRHHRWYHKYHGDIRIWGESQLAGNRFSNLTGGVSGFDSLLKACCDTSYTDPNSDLSVFVDGPPSTTAYGSTHHVIIDSFPDYPLADFITAVNNRGTGWNTADMTCPDYTTAAGYKCVDNQGNEVAP